MYYIADGFKNRRFKEIFKREDIEIALPPKNTELYAFAYIEDERALNYLCYPTKGKIDGLVFHTLKKNGELAKNGVSVYSRIFSDTYEEAVEGFNVLINYRITNLKNEISRIEKMLIEGEMQYATN